MTDRADTWLQHTVDKAGKAVEKALKTNPAMFPEERFCLCISEFLKACPGSVDMRWLSKGGYHEIWNTEKLIIALRVLQDNHRDPAWRNKKK